MAGGDWNVPFGWQFSGEEMQTISLGSGAKLRQLKLSMMQRALQLVPQRDPAARTHISRKNDGSGGQINGTWCSLPHRCSPVEVALGSRKIIDTDHEYITTKYIMQFPSRTTNNRSGVRSVVQVPIPPRRIDQSTLMRLARECTGPRLPPRIPVPEDIKIQGSKAKRTRDPRDWKTYMSALRNFRAKTREQSLARASVGGAEYRKVKREGVCSWQTQFGAETDGEPLSCINQHFQSRFDAGDGASWIRNLNTWVEKFCRAACVTGSP